MTGPIGGIVLAAGASTRAGCAKALATVDGEPLVVRAARVLDEGGADDVVVVVGPPLGAQVALALRGAEAERGLRVLENDEPERGMLSSLKIALRFGESIDWRAAVVLLVDQPHVRPADVRALIDAFGSGQARVVRVADAAGRRGHPYLITRPVFAQLLAAPDDLGARPVLAEMRPESTVLASDPRALDDVDTPEELAGAGVTPE